MARCFPRCVPTLSRIAAVAQIPFRPCVKYPVRRSAMAAADSSAQFRYKKANIWRKPVNLPVVFEYQPRSRSSVANFSADLVNRWRTVTSHKFRPIRALRISSRPRLQKTTPLDTFVFTGRTLGPYEVLAPIGKGGMGEVYRARDSRLNRDVAIKVSRQEFGERFEREARLGIRSASTRTRGAATS